MIQFDFQYIENDSIGGTFESNKKIFGFHLNLVSNVLTTDPKIRNKREIKKLLACRILKNLTLNDLNN